MPRKPLTRDGVIKTVVLDKKAWAALRPVADMFHVSRTWAVNRAIAWMVKERFIPGFKKEETK